MTQPDIAALLAAGGVDTFAVLPTAPAPRQHDRYTFLTADLVTGRIVDEVTGVGQVQFGKALNDAGTASCQFRFTPSTTEPDRADRLRAATMPGRTALYIVDGSQIAWGGPIWTRRADLATDTVQLGCADFFSYLKRRVLRATPPAVNTAFVRVDDNDIIRAWLALVNAVGLIPDSGAAGNLTDQTNWDYEYPVVGSLIQNLAATIGGPDVYSDVVGDVDTPQRVLRLGTPRLGRPLADSQLVFDDAALLQPSWDEDTSSLTTMQWAPGAGSEVDQMSASSTSAVLLQAGFPPLDSVSQVYDKVTDPATLQGHADADLAVHAGVVVDFGLNGAVFGYRPLDVLPGDEARVVMRSPWLPGGEVDLTTRVTAWSATVPDDGGDEQLVPTFGELVTI